MTKAKERLIAWWKKANGVEKVAVGNICKIVEDFGLTDERELSTGIHDGNFSEWRTSDGKLAYSYLYDPLGDHDAAIVFFVRGRRNLAQLREMVETVMWVLWKSRELEGKKRCWECGREFTFVDIDTEATTPWEDWRERLDYWRDSYCGC